MIFTKNVGCRSSDQHPHSVFRCNILGIGPRLPAGGSGIRISEGTRNFPILQNVQTICRAHSASYSVDTMIISKAKEAGADPSGRAV